MSSANGRSEGGTLLADQLMMDEAENDGHSENTNNNSSIKPLARQSKLILSENGTCAQNGNHKVQTLAITDPHTKPGNKALSKTDKEIVRIIGQHLRYLGFNRTFEQLTSESGCVLEDPHVSKLRVQILNGQWDLAEIMLETLKSVFNITPADLTKMKFLLLEQKYMEVLNSGQLHQALDVLRSQVTPLKSHLDRVHILSSYLMCTSSEDLKEMSSWSADDSRNQLLENLEAFLPAQLAVPAQRLLKLLTQSLEYQVSKCQYHNTLMTDLLNSVSLLTDHSCSKDDFPCQTTQVLMDHSDEAWFCKFSPDGLMLATGSKDGYCNVYDVDQTLFRLTLRKSLSGPPGGVSFVCWSPNNNYLAICGTEDSSELSIWDVTTGELKSKLNQSSEDFLTCVSWYPDGSQLSCGGLKGHFYSCNTDGHLNSMWDCIRVQCLACLPDNRTVIAADTHHRMRSYDFELHRDSNLFQEEAAIMSLALNSKGNKALLNIANQSVHMWDLDCRSLLRKYRGTIQSQYTIHSTFGGLNEDFIASGSEDHRVFIWHVNNELPLISLSGHSGTVNCVHWNPTLPSMLASASDDGTVRIWGPKCHCDDSLNPDEVKMNGSGGRSGRDDAWRRSEITTVGYPGCRGFEAADLGSSIEDAAEEGSSSSSSSGGSEDSHSQERIII